MIEVEFRYEKPADDGFKVLKSTKFDWPESLDELTADQFVKFIELLEKQQLEDVAKINLFFAISGCSKWFVRRRMSPDEFKMQVIHGLVEPLLDQHQMKDSPLRHWFKGFVGMDSHFSNFTWAQFCLVDAYFTKYQQGAEELLDSICALIYVPIGQAFDGDKADDYLPFWADQPHYLKRAVVINFSMIKRFIYEDCWYPRLFPKSAKLDDKTPQPTLTPKEIDYQEITIGLSGGPFGPRETLDREPVHNVLKYIDMKLSKPAKK